MSQDKKNVEQKDQQVGKREETHMLVTVELGHSRAAVTKAGFDRFKSRTDQSGQ